MATREADTSTEVFRRRFQQKLSDHYSDNVKDDKSTFEVNPNEKDERLAKRESPFSLQNFMWLGASVAVLYFCDILSVIVYDLRIRNVWFVIGALSLGLHVGIATFLVLWLTIWKKVSSDEWETNYPSAVPVATASLVIGIICLCIGLWPVWGFLTPIILLTLSMGTVVIIAMIG